MKRRDFLLSGVALAGGVGAGFWGAGLIEYMGSAPDTPWRALTAEEAVTLDRFAEELIPADEFCGGAHDAKVVRFIDWQLADGAPYAWALPRYRDHLAKIGTLSAAEVEKRFPDFFKLALTHVKQGFYGSPHHGGNDNYLSYRMLGVAGPAVTGRNVPGKENHL